MTVLLEGRGLSYSLSGVSILQSIDVTVEAGEAVAVTGPSGSGKTTLLYLLAGMIRPSSGTVSLDGKPLDRLATPADGVATVLQGYGLVSLLTAAENVQVALRAAGADPQEAATTAVQALADLGLGGHERQLADELSGGQQQRTAVARALALRPRLLIADEPTAELDPAARALVMQRLLEVPSAGGSIVIATHDPDVAEACSRRIELTHLVRG
ncbi:MAG TPA: heme ABC exporter ATP-binding protein CcmA [Acidimicrobiales bacterium]|jgi:heme ABC exporter ATP-binding subunit CcmA|nr:heme ABC exporter ATP-binding protein CcmA [Acidimicrobiales bacterium]